MLLQAHGLYLLRDLAFLGLLPGIPAVASGYGGIPVGSGDGGDKGMMAGAAACFVEAAVVSSFCIRLGSGFFVSVI